jgi:hypothetical protein
MLAMNRFRKCCSTRREILQFAGKCTLTLPILSTLIIHVAHAQQDIAVAITHKGELISDLAELRARRVCASFRARQLFGARLESTGIALLQVPSSEMPIAFQTGVCDAMVFAGTDRQRLLDNVSNLLGGNTYEWFVIEQ